MRSDAPACVGIILDGNRRWAREHGVPTLQGHRKGLDAIEPVARAARDAGIRHLVIYAFSLDNWKRTKEEVSYLMDIFEEMAREPLARLAEERIAARFVGDRERFPASLQQAMRDAENGSPEQPALTLFICMSYSGRAEIAHAARSAADAGEELCEDSIARHLWTAGMPDPDLIIRTGGAKRLSDFLPWQSIYSELYFIEKFWPDFTPADLHAALDEYATRERRRGK